MAAIGLAAALAAGLAVGLAGLRPGARPPHHPNSDLYTHLSVARHLLRGDGFRTDIAYPLSLAYPFARELPQPLLHRAPGYAILLAPVVAVAGAGGGSDGDRDTAAPGPVAAATAAERLAPWLGLLLLSALAGLGAAAAARRGRAEAVPPWLLLLAWGPALPLSVAWARVEVPAALLLLAGWVRWRDDDGSPGGAAAGAGDGLLAAAPALLRPDLAWVPLLWWAARGRTRPRRRLLAAAAVWLGLLAPWAVRNAALTGDPFFSLQARAEHLKDTARWPGYSVYRSLAPENLLRTLVHDPVPVLRKTARGLRFYLTGLGGLLPWALWAAGLALALLGPRPDLARGPPGARPAPTGLRRPLPLAGLTLLLLALQYGPFDHDLRHLLPVLPVVTWEICLAAADRLRGWRAGPGVAARAALLLAAALAACLLTPPRLPGWRRAADDARRAGPAVAAAAAAAVSLPPGPIFTDAAAVAWRADRPAVWAPLDRTVEARIRELVPGLAAAPVLDAGLLGPAPTEEPIRP